MEDRLFRALAVLRIVVLLNAIGLNLWRYENFDHPVAGVVAILVMVGWTAYVHWAYREAARRTTWLLAADLAVAAGLILATPLIKGSEGLRATIPGYWVMAALLAWAIHWRWRGGLFAAPTARDRAVPQAAIEPLGIAHLAARPATMISGGERQLALIARALAQEAQLMLLDEPTAALDFGNQGKVMREIRRLADAGLGVLFSTHDPNHAARFADQALLIRQGRTLASGPAPCDRSTLLAATATFQTR